MKFLAKVKYVLHNVPAPLKHAAEATALAGGAAFLAAFKPLLPALIGAPSMPAAKAAILTAVAAGVAASYHVGKASLKSLVAKWAAIPVPEAPATPPPAA